MIRYTVYVCGLATLVFLRFPLLLGGTGAVWKRKPRMARDAGGARLKQFGEWPPAIKGAF